MEVKIDDIGACRFCANAILGEYKFIFSSDNEDFVEQINTCLPVTVRKTDLLPKQVCQLCIKSFSQYQRFFYQVLEAEKKLKSLWRQTQVTEKSTGPCVDCPLCIEGAMGLKDGRVILGPMRKTDEDNQKALGHVDNECLAQMIRQELVNEVTSKEINSEESRDESMKFEYVCFTCGAGFVTEEEISAHECVEVYNEGETSPVQQTKRKEITEEEKAIVREEIEKLKHMRFKSDRVRKKTVRLPQTEKAEGPAQCEICGKEYKTHKRLKDHLSFCHPRVYHKCDLCDLKFAKKWLLTTHMRKHTGELPYQCKKCGKEFVSNSHLWNHNNFHHGQRNLQCDLCEATGFYTKQDLDNHVRTKHTKERSFHCKICNKSFMSTGVFYQHRFIHTDIRKYSCTYCPKSFRRWQTLHNHIRIHTGERPYPCDVCGRAFRQRGDMKKHKATQHANA